MILDHNIPATSSAAVFLYSRTLGTFLEKRGRSRNYCLRAFFCFFNISCAFRDLKTSKPSPSTRKAFYDRLRCNCWILADFESAFFPGESAFLPVESAFFLLVWMFENSLLGLKGGGALLMVGANGLSRERWWSLMLK